MDHWTLRTVGADRVVAQIDGELDLANGDDLVDYISMLMASGTAGSRSTSRTSPSSIRAGSTLCSGPTGSAQNTPHSSSSTPAVWWRGSSS